MNELRVYKEQTTVYLFSWEVIVTTAEAKKIADAVNSWVRLIEIWWDYIATSNISQITTKKIGEVESFILNFDKEIQGRLREIKKKRELEWLKINIEVLKNAYKSKYWEDLF